MIPDHLALGPMATRDCQAGVRSRQLPFLQSLACERRQRECPRKTLSRVSGARTAFSGTRHIRTDIALFDDVDQLRRNGPRFRRICGLIGRGAHRNPAFSGTSFP